MVRSRGGEGWRPGFGLQFRVATGSAAMLLVLLAAGCGPDQSLDAGPGDTSVDSTDSSSSSVNSAETEAVRAAPAPNRDEILVSWEDWLTSPHSPPAAPDGALQLVACRWLGPARWEAEVDWQSTPAPTIDQPLRVPILIGYVDDNKLNRENRGPEQDWGYGFTAGTAELIGNGRFKVAMSGSPAYGPGISHRFAGWWNASPRFQYEPTGRCAAQLMTDGVGDPDFAAGVELQLDIQPVNRPLAEPGTIQRLAAEVPTTPDWADHPMAALAQLLTLADIPVDRFHLAPDQAIQGIDIKHTEECLIVVVSQAGNLIQQSQGCEATPLVSLVEGQRIPADGWTVVVDGDPEFVDAVQAFRFLGAVDRASAPMMDLSTAEGLVGVGPESEQE